MADKHDPSQDRFDADTKNGVLTVLRDEGLYRHLRFRFDTGSFRWFEIVTWPDRLVITGDCETYTFTRLEDMLDFFRADCGRINPGYWMEKILDGRDRARSFDWDTFRAEALDEFDRATKSMNPLHRTEARAELEDALDSEPDEYGGVDVLRNFSYRADDAGSKGLFEFDLSDGAPDGKTWDYHYIWCCRAIVWAIQQYDAHKAQKEASNAG